MSNQMKDIHIPVTIGGVTFKNPFFVASGPTTKSVKQLMKIEETGWAAASIKLSIDPAPYINRKPRYSLFKDRDALAFTAEKRLTFEEGLKLIRDAKPHLHDLKLMANITYAGDNGVDGWVNMAKKFEEAGADIIELNMCCPNMSYNVEMTSGGNKPQATVTKDQDFFHLDLDAFKWVFDLNVTGAVLTTMVFGELMAKQGSGNVINIASMSSYHPLTNTVAYCGAKAAVANFTEWMATHFNQNYSNNIRVNAIAPGFLLTNQNRYLLTNEDGSATDRGSRVLVKTPMGRYGEPEEMAGPVMFLCSEAASFVNGAVLPVDGGFASYWGV